MSKLPKNIQNKLRNYPKFYRKVWLACSEIPRGKTLTYGELARKIGHPNASRAVGSALAKNPFAPVIPCHRVIRSDGKLGGYSGHGGTRKKLKLLLKEKLKA
ncbi:MAG: MGMT family protein [Endomicrobiales bacterium]|nr:MGMT family protein [Endomicrobiales bacterium]